MTNQVLSEAINIMSIAESNNEGPLSGHDTNSPDVNRDKGRPGRKPKSYYTRAIQDILDGTARDAAILLQKLIEQRRGHKYINSGLQRACEYVIDHALGKSRPKAEHSAGVMTYKQLADSAEKLEQSGREIIAEAEEIADKYTENNPTTT